MISQTLVAETGDIAALGRGLLAVVLGFAAWSKVRDWDGFRAVLRFLMFRVRAVAIALLAVCVVGLELLLAGLLVTGLHTDMAAWGTVGFLGVATSAILILRRRGYKGRCACFGRHAAAGSVKSLDIVRNAVLIAVAFAVAESELPRDPLWAFPAAKIALFGTTTLGVLLSYGMVAAVIAMRAAGAAPRSEQVGTTVRSADQEEGGRET